MFEVGAARCDITPELGRPIQGASVAQVARSIRDPLEVNGVLLRGDHGAVVMLSVDVAALEDDVHRAIRIAVAEAVDLSEADVLVACTHTHSGPSVLPTAYGKPLDHTFLDHLPVSCAQVARQAYENARPALVRLGGGETLIGHNRRHCWADGEHTMHLPRRDFENFTGMEGPTDPRHTALLATDENGEPIAVIHGNTAHPTLFYGADFFSADYPGEARSILRRALAPDLPVLYLNGPFGDIGPAIDRHGVGVSRHARCVQIGAQLAGATLELVSNANPAQVRRLDHRLTTLDVPLRLPEPELVEAGRAVLTRVDAGDTVPMWDVMLSHGRVQAAERHGHRDHETLRLHVLRIDDLAIVTHPTELYCQFGIDLKRRSPAGHTVIADVTDGFSGYCPTLSGVLGGGYSAMPLGWTRLAPEAGYRLVDEAARVLHDLWRKE